MPFAEHDGMVLRESMAILRYVTKVFDVPEHWYPKVIFKKNHKPNGDYFNFIGFAW